MFSVLGSMVSKNIGKLRHKLKKSKILPELTWSWPNKPWFRNPVQLANSRIGAFSGRVLNLNHFVHKKSENLHWEKGRYITGREKTFSDTAQYFHLNHLTNLPKCKEKNFFSPPNGVSGSKRCFPKFIASCSFIPT